MADNIGVFSLMLHSHIPYCRKSGVWPAGEEWLFEAMHETYLPLLSVFRNFQRKNLKPRIMVGIVPILAEQLADPYMNDRFCVYMEDKINRAEKDIARFGSDALLKKAAAYYLDYFNSNYHAYKNDFYRNILGSFKWLQEEKVVEVLTSGATHGFLPLLESDSAVYSQIHLGVTSYEKHFGMRPKGIWLPECAYRPKEWSKKQNKERRAIDEWLADEKIQYFFVEDIGILNAEFIDNKHHESRPSTYRGYKLESGVCVFGRNTATGKQVWSPDSGYPGDPYYREFHQKDIQSGIQYWRITQADPKAVYEPDEAKKRVREHAAHFKNLLIQKNNEEKDHVSECAPIIVSPYDCELFGHWWHEGPQWIEQLYSLLLDSNGSNSNGSKTIRPLSLSEYISTYQETFSTIRMKPSTWGLNGDFTVWKNPEHGWLWPYINASAEQMEQVINQLIQENRLTDPYAQRLLKQLGRELLLMEGSDWPFLLFTTQAKEYANQRFHNHHQRFNKLIWAAKNVAERQRISERDLHEMEEIDNPWADLNVNLFNRK